MTTHVVMDFLHVSSVLCPLLSCTNIYVYTILLLMWLLFTNKLWTLVKYSIPLPNFVRVSLSISELHEDTSYPLFLVVVRKRICLPRNYHNIGDKSWNSTFLPGFKHVSTLVSGLQMRARPIVMYGLKLFIVVLWKA